MRSKILILLIVVFITIPVSVNAAEPKAAFIRSDGLWLKKGTKETRLVSESGLTQPKWSFDGTYISYYDFEGKLWAYSLSTHDKKEVFHSSVSLAQWSPREKTIAFKDSSILNIRKLEPYSPFSNAALGTGSYSWTPDGQGFIVSSDANLTPAGWTNVAIFHVPMDASGNTGKVKKLAELPGESDDFFAIGTSPFLFSVNKNLMAFIACPTASYSADRNFLSLLTTEGKKFRVVGEVLADINWMKWSTDGNFIAFIEGEGRLTTENKKLTIFSTTDNKKKSYTPAGYADGDFTWTSKTSIVVSRKKESGWNIAQEKRPKPQLVSVDLMTGGSRNITSQSSQYSDTHPVSLKDNQLFWERHQQSGIHVWQADSNGSSQKIWIENVTPEQWSIYQTN
ncbi:translocation protein TolB [Fictibacillus aquaticus]|uniref:Translocation protein TolB n=1 Tax=Fictibacillus aquaticus TaxID=2021314 RepID=A0A235F716_9BACL|nr:hypothetical protein [Fictibacillus aquaticus]OYD56904.1 hypothetical protein CGZ90_15230 [Fictibacillus aquaticus]